MSAPSARLGLLQISGASVLWGTGGLCMALIASRSDLSVLTVSAYRMLIASAALVLLVAAVGQLTPITQLLRTHPKQAILAGVLTGAYQALYFAACIDVGVTIATVVSLGVAPILLLGWESLRHRQSPTASQWLITTIALMGLILVSVAGDGDQGGHPIRGVLAALASGTTYAATTAVSSDIVGRTTPLALTTVASLAGGVALLPIALVGGGPLTSSDPTVLATLAYLGVATLALAYGLLYAGLRTVAGSAATIATLLEPFTAAALAGFILGERIGLQGTLGMALILAAIVGLSFSVS